MTLVTVTSGSGRKFHLRIFGCQMNWYDGDLIRGSFLSRGWQETQSAEEADAILFHTCSVREQAERRVHSLLGEVKRLKRARPELVVVVCGCMADREGEELFHREPHVDVVCGSRHFPRLADFVDRVQCGEERVLQVGKAESPVDSPIRDFAGQTPGHAAFVGVMRGCDLHCTYCIVPSVRGPVESRPASSILQECRQLADRGVTDVTLLGQTIDAWGRDLPGRPGLAKLLDGLSEIEEIARVRLITLHPSYCNEELADAMARSPQFLRLLPLPLQSGSDSVLRRMKRGYNLDLYRRRIEILKSRMPDLELVSDWIVGFPGETEEEFECSVAAMREFGFLQSFVFQYSPRPGTVADGLEDDIPAEEKGRRNRVLLDLQREIAVAKTPLQLGKQSRFLLEEVSDRNPGYWRGRTREGYRSLLPEQQGLLVGTDLPVQIQEWHGRELFLSQAPGRILVPRISTEMVSV